jgi:N-acetylmuramoyl-L-alanine amidase
MTLACSGARILRVFSCLIFLTLSSLQASPARQWDTQGASRAYEEARKKQNAITQAKQPALSQYLECAKVYRKVYCLDPHYRHAGDAIYEEALMYQKMGDNFSNLEHYKIAVKRFNMLVTDYGGNQNCPNALMRMAVIYSNHLKNEPAAQDAYLRLRTHYKSFYDSMRQAHPEIARKAAPQDPKKSAQIAQPEIPISRPSTAAAKLQGLPRAITEDTKPLSSPANTGNGNKATIKDADSAEKSPARKVSEIATTPKAAPLTSHGDRTLTRILGLKIGRIVIDPGHGGHDQGTIGPGGLLEKNLVLSLAHALKTMLEEKLGSEVLLTREDDTFIPLEDRTAFANRHHADLFISIHANSSRVRSISGVETYYLDFAKTDAEREIAARENAGSNKKVSDLEDLIKKIAKADKSVESRELASLIQQKLYNGERKLLPSTKNRGVRRAPFVVLSGANMPSVLAEVAFISNPKDEKLLGKKANQDALAKALFAGIEGYVKTLGSEIVHNLTSKNK